MLADVSANHTEWFPLSSQRRTLNKIKARCEAEGIAFLTKTMPSLRKELDRALSGTCKLNTLRFVKIEGSELPMFMGEFFSRVFDNNGWIKPDPCVVSVRILRQVLDLFYKYKLPYDENTEQETISLFEETDGLIGNPTEAERRAAQAANHSELRWSCVDICGEWGVGSRSFRRRTYGSNDRYVHFGNRASSTVRCRICDAVNRWWIRSGITQYRQVDPGNASDLRSIARELIFRVLAGFDPLDITPRHGPGAVSTGEKAYEKMTFSRIYSDSDEVFPHDEYFYTSLTHVCDSVGSLTSKEVLPYGTAKVVLVPKDSRGPRIISAEPCEKQWLQQGIMKALTAYIEAHPLTRGQVNFTNQSINQRLALQGSVDGAIATLDLKEASDRVSLRLVKELFPEHVYRALAATRSTHTLLPDGRTIKLNKFAPMGSALCFPVMALTIWAVSTACVLRTNGYSKLVRVMKTRDGDIIPKEEVAVYVYGDDVIIKQRYAADVIKALEFVGLKVNVDKCFLTGFFRESCGVDAFRGQSVTPVRIKTVWSTSPDASTYASWIAYANSFWSLGFRRTAQLIAEMLREVYGPIPVVEDVYFGFEDLSKYKDKDLFGYPHLSFRSDVSSGIRRRWNPALQRFQHYVYTVKPKKEVLSEGRFNGWSELLRYLVMGGEEFRAGVYALPRTSKLVRRWR